MATRLQGTYYSNIHGHQFDIDIDDADYGGSAIDFTILDLDFHWHGINEKIYNPIITSSVDVVIKIDSSSLNSFVSALIGAEEERFTIKIQKNSSLYWVGMVLVDEIRKEDRGYTAGYTFTLSATDGIGRLKDVDYNNAGTAYTGKETVMEHLFNVLGKINLDSYWGVSDIYVTSVVNWWENSHTFASTTDPLTLTRFDHRAFIKLDKNANREYLSAFDVLELICKQWGIRFFHSAGRYYLIQVSEYANTGTVYLRHFVKAGTFDSVGSVASFSNTDKTWGNASDYENGNGSADLVGLSPAEFNYFPPLDHVRIDYNHSSIQNIAVDAAWNSDASVVYTIDEVDSNGQTSAAIFTFDLRYKATYTNPANFIPVHLKFQFLVSIDNGSGTIYYLKRTATKNNTGSVTLSSPSWVTTISYWEFFPIVSYTDNFYQTQTFGDTTPALPQDGELDMQVTFVRAYNANNSSVIDSFDYTESWIVTNFYLEILIDGTLESQSSTTRYRVDNTDATTNSAKVELDFPLGDGPTGNALGHYEVSDGANWTNSSAWRKSNSGDYDFTINSLLAREILSRQITPVPRWNGTVRGNIEIFSTLVRDSMNLIALGVKYSGRTDEWEGEWFQISTNPTPITELDSEEWIYTPQNPNDDEPGPVAPPAPPSQGGPPPTPTGQDDTGLADPTYTDIAISDIDVTVTQDSNITDVDIDAGNEDEVFIGGDSVILVNSVTNEQQIVIIDSSVDHSTGDTTIGILETVSNYELPAGSYIIANPIEQQANIQWGRRKFLDYQLVAFGTDLTTSTSYVNFDPFLRPYSAPATATGYQLEGKKYLRRVYWLCATNPSASALVSYTLQVVRGATPTVVATTTLSGLVTEATVTPSNGEDLLQDDYYYFRIKQNSASGLSMNKGLHCMLEIINLPFSPDQITGLELWIRSDADVYSDAGTTYCTDGDTVQEWHDQTSNGYDVSQTTAGSKPTWNTGGQNGYPYLAFDGSDDYMVQSSVLGLTDYPFTIIVAFQQDSAAGAEESVVAINDNSGTGTDYHTIFADALAPELEAASKDGATEYSSTNYYTPGQFMITTGIWSSDTSRQIFFNLTEGVENTDSVNWDSAVLDEFLVGRLKNSGARRDFMGDVYEILVYSAALSDAERQRVYRYLDRKYNTPAYFFEPDHLKGLQLWLDAGVGVYSDAGSTLATDSDTVEEWHDQSSNSNDSTQTTTSLKPTYQTNVTNGRPVIRFDGTDDYLEIAGSTAGFNFLHSTEGTVFVVAMITVANPNAISTFLGNSGGSSANIGSMFYHEDRNSIPKNDAAACWIVKGSSGNHVVLDRSSDDLFPSNDAFHIAIYSVDPDNGTAADRSIIYVDGSGGESNNTDTNTVSGSNASYNMQIGAGGNGAFPLTGDIAEVIVYDTQLSTDNKQNVLTYLANKYNKTL